MAATLYTCDGSISELSQPITLKTLQEAVKGYIELVPRLYFRAKGKVMLANEDGGSMGLDLNRRATTLCHGYPILGDVVVMDEGDFKTVV